ncbi:hypothetical protein HPB47_004312 [Ixodes persulcatus]|uniref:Uncharacterized protein n=1 Tax=Ixodes persulcatus TaxID=34615 RepID=A0AC60PG63_IXOPE|nr:hypothetical protein HPB47_004312 [Ixodes persulcatus]
MVSLMPVYLPRLTKSPTLLPPSPRQEGQRVSWESKKRNIAPQDDYMDFPRPPDSPVITPPPEDMDFPALEVNEDSPAELGLAGNTGFAFPPPLLLLSHSNPFAPLATLENAQQSEGKSCDLLTASCIVSTAPEGQKRARSTVQASTASRRSTQARTSARSVQTTSSQGMYGKDSSHDEDGYTLVTYSRKKRYPLMAATPPTPTQPPAPRLSRLTVILRPCQPCRILDEPYIKLDEALSSHLRTSLALVQGTRTPNFTTRFLTHSNQLPLDVYDPTVRDAFLKIKSLPIRGNPSQEIANPWHDLRSTKAQRAAYLSMAANPLSIPKIPSQHFSRREAVMIRQIQTGTLLTPHLLQRFRGNDGAGSSTASGICKNCNSKADLVHLMWSCPLYNLPRQRALDLITNAPVPASLNAWACPDTTISPKHALELWEALLTFIRDPTAPPVGDRLLPDTAKRIRPPPPSSTKALKPWSVALLLLSSSLVPAP